MTTGITWGHQEDEDHLGTPAKRVIFDMHEHWDPDTDPHPNTKVMNSLVDFGKKYINGDPTGGSGFSISPDTFSTGKEVTQNNIYTPPSQQANNQGLLANVAKPVTQAATTDSFSIKIPSTGSMPGVKPDSYGYPKVTANSFAPPKAGNSLYTQSLDSVNAANIAEGRATGDLIGAVGGQYLKYGRTDVLDDTNRAESRFTGDLINRAGKAMVDYGTDIAEHDSHSDFNLHFSQNPDEYSRQVGKTLGDAGGAWMNTHDVEHRTNIETYGDDVQKGFRKRGQEVARFTSKFVMGANEALTVGTDKYANREILAHETRQNRFNWEDTNTSMMTSRDIRTDTAENFASDTFKYLYQTGISQHFVNLTLIRKFRGAPFMMQDGIEMLDSSFDVWADNIAEKGDHSYLNALTEAVIKDHPSTDDVLINLMARFMGGINGDALLFWWSSMKKEEKQQIMKEVKGRQKVKMQNTP